MEISDIVEEERLEREEEGGSESENSESNSFTGNSRDVLSDSTPRLKDVGSFPSSPVSLSITTQSTGKFSGSEEISEFVGFFFI